MAPNVKLRSSSAEPKENTNATDDPYIVNVTPCTLEQHQRKVNCKGNPSCLFGLGENSSEGVMQTNKTSKKLYQSARVKKRTEEVPFAGLRNLGATCYANVVLQVLFFLRPFREAILNTKISPQNAALSSSESTNGTLVRDVSQMENSMTELQFLFAHLQGFQGSAVSPKKFLEALELTTFVEQDIQEFSNLLLSLVEKYFQSLPEGKFSSLIPNLFRGSRRYVTKCQVCGEVSQASRESTKFTELQVAVYKPCSIVEALQNLISEEVLTGDNQFRCEYCCVKRDATRKMVFDNLPPILILQLLRTTFIVNTGERKKTHAKVSFEKSLNFHRILELPEEGGMHHLKAICYHRGGSAYSGHYTVRLFDDHSGSWFDFDDIQVTRVTSTSEKGFSTQNDTETVEISDRRKRFKVQSENNEASVNSDQVTLHSTSACMLVYVYEDPSYRCGDIKETILPEFLKTLIEKENDTLNETYWLEKEKIDRKVAWLEQRKSEYLNLLPYLPVFPESKDTNSSGYNYIPTDWLKRWVVVKDEELEPIDCSPYICTHGFLGPYSIDKVKRVGKEAFDFLVKKYGIRSSGLFGPECHCTECLKIFEERNVKACFWKLKNDEFITAYENYELEAFHNENVVNKSCLVDKTFLKKWKKVSKSCRSDIDFMEKMSKLVQEQCFSKHCIHEKLNQDEWLGVSDSLGEHFQSLLNYIIEFSAFDGPLPVDNIVVFVNETQSVFCEECEGKRQDKQEQVLGIRQRRKEEKQNMAELLKPKYSLQLVRVLLQHLTRNHEDDDSSASSRETFYLLSSSWLEQWLDFVTSGENRPLVSPLDGLFCVHGLLWYSVESADDLFERRISCVSSTCWSEIRKRYSGDACLNDGVSILYDQSASSNSITPRFSIPCCDICRRKEKTLERKEEVELILIKVQSTEEILDKKVLNEETLKFYFSYAKSEMMTTRRSKVIRIRCNPQNTISQLKLIIFQYTDIPPAAQQLYENKNEGLCRTSSFLNEYSIYDGSILFLCVDHCQMEFGVQDFYELPDYSQIELGFAGTQLTNL
eukprot:jgi/Galph1/3890/GphlegSOOS_G2512.1